MAPRAVYPPLAVTQGDPSGIGIEITLKAWMSLHHRDGASPFFLVADPDFVIAQSQQLGLDVPVHVVSPGGAGAVFAEALPIVALRGETRGAPGRPDAADAPATIASMEHCVGLIAKGEASAVVTNPVSKEILHRAGFKHPGQTEFMGELAGRLYGPGGAPVMLLWSPLLAVVPLTVHVALTEVPGLIQASLILETIRTVARDFTARFGIARPRIAVTGLNPHAGEGGDMGREEIEVIAPALARLAAEGLAVTGPHPADTLFHAAARKRYDVVVTMYHDQALIPVKTLAFDKAVNVTLGLPFVRTSPDHGTAYDIAGQGVADPSSLIAALDLAGALSAQDRAACRAR